MNIKHIQRMMESAENMADSIETHLAEYSYVLTRTQKKNLSRKYDHYMYFVRKCKKIVKKENNYSPFKVY